MKATVKLFHEFFGCDFWLIIVSVLTCFLFLPHHLKHKLVRTYRNENNGVQFLNCIQMIFTHQNQHGNFNGSWDCENPIDTVRRLKSCRRMAIKQFFKSLITINESTRINKNHTKHIQKEINNLAKSDFGVGVKKPNVSGMLFSFDVRVFCLAFCQFYYEFNR